MADLRRFEPLLKYSRYLGADRVLRRHLGVGDDYPVPLAAPHGVDFGFSKVGYDIHSVEPIYWATNDRSFELASRVKPALRIPHPFLLASQWMENEGGAGTLVVGPPPGPTADGKLAGLLGGFDPSTTTILVKPQLNFQASKRFWEEKGFRTVSLADGGEPTYERMAELFARYDHFVGGTVSSALFFGAALGKKLTLLRGFRFAAYEQVHIHSVMDYGSQEAVGVVRLLDSGDTATSTAVARRLLGAHFDADPARIRAAIEKTVEGLKWPLFSITRYPPPLRRLAQEIALRTGRHGLLSRRYGDVIRARMRPDVLIVDIDEVAHWLDGASGEHLAFGRTRYVRGTREPGMAVELYDSEAVAPA